ERWTLTVAALIVFVMFIGILVLFGAQIRAQIAIVSERLPAAIDSFASQLGLGRVSDQLPDMIGGRGSSIVARLAGYGWALFGAVTDSLLVVIAGIYIAANPKLYRDGLVKLFPLSQHERVRSSLDAVGEALKLWLRAQLMAMIFVGLAVMVGVWLIGLPSPFALGLIAALLEFVPFIGPVLGALPAVLIASTVDGATVLWTVLLFAVIQQVESNIVFPLLGRRMVSLPPALALFAILAAGVVFGPLGLLFGFPLAVVAFVLVKKLYVRETLGEETPLPGEKTAPSVTSG
ncbi:MAG TPA: AI-2E family transporter, partial [Beijerinckiaceae bacterium]|nr:AI-2E family transporter [Beijerinckiaceae bacterium]